MYLGCGHRSLSDSQPSRSPHWPHTLTNKSDGRARTEPARRCVDFLSVANPSSKASAAKLENCAAQTGFWHSQRLRQ